MNIKVAALTVSEKFINSTTTFYEDEETEPIEIKELHA